MGCTSSKSETLNSSMYVRTKDNYNVPLKFFNLEKEYTLLLCHGISESFKSVCEWIETTLLPLDLVNVLVFDYYACSEASEYVNESCIYTDCEAVLWFTTECLRLSKRKLILYGRCLGSGVSLYFAERNPDIAGLILESSLIYALRTTYNFKISFPREFYLSNDILKKIQCPVMFIHGNEDEITPIRYIKDLHNNMKNFNSRFIEIEGKHELKTEAVIQWIKDFIIKNN